MDAKQLYDIVLSMAHDFGMTQKNDGHDIIDEKGNTVVRKNLGKDAFSSGGAFFGLLRSDQDFSGPYSDFSFVVFPGSETSMHVCLVSLCIGSNGFQSDYDCASQPGVRRMFLKLQTQDGLTFFKTDFLDKESTSSDLLKMLRSDYPDLSTVIETYKTVLPAARIVDFDSLGDDGAVAVIKQWLAMYAKMRDWGTKVQKKLADDVVNLIPPLAGNDEETEVRHLLDTRRYVVLQGAPGTGKTYTALKIAKCYDKCFFTQFHAETTYSDFVYGIEPDIDAGCNGPQFRSKPGVLYKAIKYARDNSSERVLLIIDEINRANLSNVLGPVFYLFEYQAGNRNERVNISVGDMHLSSMPANLHVIATMNTADRSLAVVDFALRRRFAWFTLHPHVIKAESGKKFMEKTFNAIDAIFKMYASDGELSLQPGQSYFVVDKVNAENAMRERLVYELMPLVKEYLEAGYLLKAKDAFSEFFRRETGRLLYE